MLRLASWAISRTPAQCLPQAPGPWRGRGAGARRPRAAIPPLRFCLLALASAGGALAALVLLALGPPTTQAPSLTAQSPLPQRAAAMRALVADAEYWLGGQPRVTLVWGLKIAVSPQTPDPQRALGDADQIAALAFDQPYITQDVAQLWQAYQSIELQAAQAAALARRVQLLRGAAAPSTTTRINYTPDYAPMASWLTMILSELQALAAPAPASVPDTIPGHS